MVAVVRALLISRVDESISATSNAAFVLKDTLEDREPKRPALIFALRYGTLLSLHSTWSLPPAAHRRSFLSPP